MITPVVSSSVQYLVNVTDHLIKSNAATELAATELGQRFMALSEASTGTLLQLTREGGITTELARSNASKVQHIYAICNQADERVTKSELRQQ